jgi:hypothetical protein
VISPNEVREIVGNRLAALLAQAQTLAGDAFTPSFEQATAWALRALGYPAASVLGATAGEVQAVSAGHVDALLDLVELRMLESIQTGWTAVTVKAGPVQEDYSSLADRLDKIVTEKRANVAARHGQWLAVPLTGNAPKRASLRAV